ncbi:hypothetical protein Hanom_Chr01g00055801 [Helianthus anomalus]
MESVELATALTIMVLKAFNSTGAMAQEFGVAPDTSPSMDNDGTVLRVLALLAAVVSFVAYLF